MDSAKNEKWNISFKKFSRLKVIMSKINFIQDFTRPFNEILQQTSNSNFTECYFGQLLKQTDNP